MSKRVFTVFASLFLFLGVLLLPRSGYGAVSFPTTTTLTRTVGAASSPYGSALTLTAMVTITASGGAVSGASVTLKDNGVAVAGPFITGAAGTVDFDISTTAVGA